MSGYNTQMNTVLDTLDQRNTDADQFMQLTITAIESVRTAITAAVTALTALNIEFDQEALAAIIGTPPTFDGTKPDPVPYQELLFEPVVYTPPGSPTDYQPYQGDFTPDTASIDTVSGPSAEYTPPLADQTLDLNLTGLDKSDYDKPLAVDDDPAIPAEADVTISGVAVSVAYVEPTATAPALPTPTTSVDSVDVIFTDPTAVAPAVPTGLEMDIAPVGDAFVAPTAVAPTLPTIEDIALTTVDLTYTAPDGSAPVVPPSETIDLTGIDVTYVAPTAPAEVLPSASDVAIGAIEWDAIFERAAAQQLRASTAEIQAANSGAALRGMAVPSVVSTGMLSKANQRAMDRVSLLAETNAVEYAKSRREDIIALAKMGIENYVAQWEEQIKSEAERRAYAELASRFKFDQAKHNLSLLQLSVEYYVSTWKAKVESELARLQYAQFAFKQEYDGAAINLDGAVKIGGLQVSLYEAVSKLGLDSELAKLQYAQFEFKQEFDQAAQNADIAVKVGGLANQIYETQSKTQLETLLAKLQFAQFEFKQAYDQVALTVDSETKLAGLGVNIYTAEVKAELDSALAKLQYAQFEFKQAYDVEMQNAEAQLKLGNLEVQSYSEQVKARLDSERIRIAGIDQDMKNLIAAAGQNLESILKIEALKAQAKGDYLRAEAAIEGAKVSRGEALARLAQANTNAAQDFEIKKAQIDQQAQIDYRNRYLETEKLTLARDEMLNKYNLQELIENQNNRYKTAETQAKVYVADAQVYGSKVDGYTKIGDLAYKIEVDVPRINAEYNLKKTELALTNNIGHLVDLVQIYAQLTNALFSASDVSLSSGLSWGQSFPFKYNSSAGDIVMTGLD